ncbi:V-type ATP synthase subunit E [Eubacteriales bacterium KG127]
MSVEKITSKILEDAKFQADSILTDAKLRADGIIKDAQDRAESLLKEYKTRGEEERDKLIERKKSVAEIDGRKLTLQIKQDVIGKAFDLAADKIANMEKDKYIVFLCDVIESSGISGGEIVMNETQRNQLGKELVKAVNERMKGELVGENSFVLSEETKSMIGGFMIKKGDIYFNGSLENLLQEEKDKIISSVAEKLF